MKLLFAVVQNDDVKALTRALIDQGAGQCFDIIVLYDCE